MTIKATKEEQFATLRRSGWNNKGFICDVKKKYAADLLMEIWAYYKWLWGRPWGCTPHVKPTYDAYI